MKNLKKILIALTVVALLISAVVLITSAADGTVEELQKLYDKIDATYEDTGAEKNPTPRAKADLLAKAYAYMNENPIDPETEGFAELLATMQAKSVELADKLYANFENMTDSKNMLEEINAVFDHLDACPPAEDTEGYAEFLVKLEAGNVKTISTFYNETLDEAATAFKKQTVFVTIFEQLAKRPINDLEANAELINNCKAGAFAVVEEVYNTYVENLANGEDTNEKYFARLTSAGALEYLISKVDIASVEGATELIDNAKVAIKDAAADKVAKQKALDAVANFTEYDWTDYRYNVKFDDGTSVGTINANSTNWGEVRTEESGNKYFTLHYGKDQSHLYTEPSIKTDDPGLVLSFDMMVSSDFIGCEFVAREPSVVMQTLFQIKADNRDGNVYVMPQTNAAGGKSTNVDGSMSYVYGAIVPNVWFNVTTTYDKTERTGSVYINYVKVLDIYYHDTIKFGGYRLGKSSTFQEISFDNIDYFLGTTYRIYDKLENMDDTQKFMYFVDYFANEDFNPTNRNAAYLKARELISSIPDSDAVAPYKEAFTNCNYEEEIRKPAMVANLNQIKTLISAFPESVTSENRLEVALQIANVDKFIANNNELINRADNSPGGYLEQAAIITEYKAAIQRVINIEDFITAVSKFSRATTYASMSRHAATAAGIYEKAGYADEQNILYIINDPVVAAFELAFNGEEITSDMDEYVSLFEYYATFVDAIAERVKFENSKRIVECIGFITSLEGYEATEEFWEANADYISTYVTIIRDITLADNYDYEYEGIDEALAAFAELDAYFYQHLQRQHINVIKTQLERYLATSAYIEKVGICTYLAGYIAENDLVVFNFNLADRVAEAVADERAEMEELLLVYEIYVGELAAQEEDYVAVLTENTVYFIDTVKLMPAAVSYAELKPLVVRASSFYYGMNVDSQEAKDAIEIYNKYAASIEEIEENSEKFVNYVNEIANIEDVDELYQKLVVCHETSKFANEDVEGVAAANVAYKAALDIYMAWVNSVNSDVAEISQVVYAVRSNAALYAALATIANIVERV